MSDELIARLRDCSSDEAMWSRQAADAIEALNLQIKDLKKLVFAAYCEGFNDGKDGGWIVGPTNQPWKASYTHKALITMEARDV